MNGCIVLCKDITTACRPASEYEIVPPNAWRFLTTHFAGGPAIPRMCAQDPSGSVQLETPIHLSVLREPAHAGAILINAPPSLPYSSLLSFTLKCYGLDGTDKWTLLDCSGDSDLDFGPAAAMHSDVTLAGIGIQVCLIESNEHLACIWSCITESISVHVFFCTLETF